MPPVPVTPKPAQTSILGSPRRGTQAAPLRGFPKKSTYLGSTPFQPFCAQQNPFTWGSGWMDWETGLINAGSVYYSARLGRFINTGPSGGGDGVPASFGVALATDNLPLRAYARPAARRNAVTQRVSSIDPAERAAYEAAWAAFETAWASFETASVAYEKWLYDYMEELSGQVTGSEAEDREESDGYSGNGFTTPYNRFTDYVISTDGMITGFGSVGDDFYMHAMEVFRGDYWAGAIGYFNATLNVFVTSYGRPRIATVKLGELTVVGYLDNGEWKDWDTAPSWTSNAGPSSSGGGVANAGEEIVPLSPHVSPSSGTGTDWIGISGRFSWGVGAAGLAAGSSKSTLRLTRGGAFSPKVYTSGWRGGSAGKIKTFKISGAGPLLGATGSIITLASNAYGLYNYYYAPNRDHIVTPDKFLMDAGFMAISFKGGPTGAVLGAAYFGVDAFYPDGWGGYVNDQVSNEVRRMEQAKEYGMLWYIMSGPRD